jgi:hypothetical protein
MKITTTAVAATVAIFGSGLSLLACAAGGLPGPNAADAQRIADRYPHSTVAELEQGRTLYAKRCATCHELFEPAHFSGPRWKAQLAEMRDRAGLKDDEERLILQYLTAVGERSPAPAKTPSGKPGDAS